MRAAPVLGGSEPGPSCWPFLAQNASEHCKYLACVLEQNSLTPWRPRASGKQESVCPVQFGDMVMLVLHMTELFPQVLRSSGSSMPLSSQICGSCGVALARVSSCFGFITLGADVVGRVSGERGKYPESIRGMMPTWPVLCSRPAARIIIFMGFYLGYP